MSDRISAAQLAEIEEVNLVRGRAVVTKLCAEVRAAWGEAEAATRALSDLLECAEHAATPRSQYAAMSDAIAAARALVGSENAARGSSVRTQESASEAK